MHSAFALTKDLPLVPQPFAAHGSRIHHIDLVPAMISTLKSPFIPRPRVLCFSRDRVLGETRCAVLQRRFDAVYVGSLGEIASLAAGAPFDIIVLCHTLSSDDRAGCLGLAHIAWPAARIVSVANRSHPIDSAGGAVVFGLAGPEALLNSVQGLLEANRPGIGPS